MSVKRDNVVRNINHLLSLSESGQHHHTCAVRLPDHSPEIQGRVWCKRACKQSVQKHVIHTDMKSLTPVVNVNHNTRIRGLPKPTSQLCCAPWLFRVL
jgi:hypothetical protein